MNPYTRFLRPLWMTAALVLLALPLSARPAARALHGMVWDDSRERIVLFGGETRPDSSLLRHYPNDTWEWNGKLWIQAYPENPPPGRAGHAMVYDPVAKRILIHGGRYGVDSNNRQRTLLLSDTWQLVGNAWQPIALSSSPPPRQQPGHAFDIGNQRLILYGGYDESSVAIYDTWVFQDSEWRQLPGGPQVNNPSMVHDPARRRTLLLGSDADGKTVMHELVGETWQQLTPENLPPCPRLGAMTFEQRFTRVVFHGGACFNAPTVSETWLWHGDDWVQIEPFPTPGRVTGFAFANDPIRAETVMFGGVDFSERSYTYILRNNRWAFDGQNKTPGGRSLFAFASDPDRRVTWLFGGIDDFGSLLSDLFLLRGGVWSRVLTEDGPSVCLNPMGTYDTDRKRFVLWCDTPEINEWDGEKWYAFTPDSPPKGRRFASMVYDENLKRVVLFGGFDEFNYLYDVWTWDGAKWTEIKRKVKEAPPARGLPAMFYDPISKRTIVYGGIGRPTPEDAIKRYDDMWAFDGAKWTELKPTTKPGPLYGAQVGWDPASNRIVMFGGKNGEEIYVNDHWAWDGSDWKKVTPLNAPSPRMNGRMAIDPESGKLMLYGGYAGYYFSEIWTVEDGTWTVHPYTGTRAGRPVRAGR